MATIRQITTNQQIETHLVALHKTQPRLSVSFPGQENISANRIVYTPEQPDILMLRLPEDAFAETLSLTISYIMEGWPHSFQTDIINCKKTGSGSAFVKIRRPGLVRLVNRRDFLRIQPGSANPIELSIAQPGNKPVLYKVQDISRGGLSVCIPKAANAFSDKKNIPVRLNLPDSGIVPARIILKNFKELAQDVRIGGQFTSISEEGRHKISRYIIANHITGSARRQSMKHKGKANLCFVGRSARPEIAGFLETRYQILTYNLKTDLSRLVRISPDVLIFNLPVEIPASVIPEIMRLPNLRSARVIVFAADEPFKPPLDVIIIEKPVDPAVLIDTIESVLADGDGNQAGGCSENRKDRLIDTIVRDAAFQPQGEPS